MPHWNADCKTWFPGVLGNVLTGGAAALALWRLYGPLSFAPVLGQSACPPGVTLRLGDLVGYLLIGMGGGRVLTSEANQRCFQRRLGTPTPTD
jgi:hypothetical protein